MKTYILKFRKDKSLLLLLLLCGVMMLSHTLYVIKTQQYPKMDEQHYTDMVSQYYRLMQKPSFSTPLEIIQYFPYRQPGYPLLGLPLVVLLGIQYSYSILLFLNGVLYIITIIGVYLIAKEFFDKTASLMAAFIFATYGWSLFYLHFTYSETATTAFVVASLLFLLKSNYFKSKKYSFLFAIVFGYGTLVRWVVPVFIAAPLLYIFYKSLKQKNRKKKKVISNILFSSFIAILLAVFPYIINYQEFFNIYVKSQLISGPLLEIVPSYRNTHFSPQSAIYYLKVFEQLTFPVFALFLSGIFITFFKRKKIIFLLIAFIIPYFAFSFGTIIKDDRYIVPIYPVLALLSVVLFKYIKRKSLKYLLIIFVLLIGIGNFLGGVWAVGPMKTGLSSILLPMPIGHPRYIHLSPVVWPPSKDLTAGKTIFAIIQKDWDKKNGVPNYVSFFNNHDINTAIYALSRYTQVEPYQFDTLQGFPIENRYKYFFDSIKNADYLLIKNEKIIDNSLPEEYLELIKEINKVFTLKNGRLPEEFVLLKTIDIPLDNTKIKIYKKTKNISDNNLKEYAGLIIQANPQRKEEIELLFSQVK